MKKKIKDLTIITCEKRHKDANSCRGCPLVNKVSCPLLLYGFMYASLLKKDDETEVELYE